MDAVKITIPDLPQTIEMLLPLKSTFDGRTQTIREWVNEHRSIIQKNARMVNAHSGNHDIRILSIFIRDLLVRNIVGEGGQRIYDAFCEIVSRKDDLKQENYRKILTKARYRWGITLGSDVMCAAVNYFRDDLHWNWRVYLAQAERNKKENFPNDKRLKIKHVKFKVRDLALSNFNPNYAAFDLHVTRVVARIGLLAYGWDVTGDKAVEFGTNPSDNDNYLFLHKFFLRISELCGGRFTPVDLDRIFWHLGRSKCGATTECDTCPIQKTCLTGKMRSSNKSLHRIGNKAASR
jgi:hypothetical protein